MDDHNNFFLGLYCDSIRSWCFYWVVVMIINECERQESIVMLVVTVSLIVFVISIFVGCML